MSSRNYYVDTAGSAPVLPALQSTVDATVCVVGGGFAGLNTALGLAERGVCGVVLLEADVPAFGASGRNGGFVFGGFSRGEDSLLRDLGAKRAKALYAGTIQAVDLIRSRIARHGIDCDDTQAGILWANWFRDQHVLKRRQALLAETFDQDWQWMDRDAVRSQLRTTRYHDALFEPRAFHFHPLKYANGLVQVAAAQGVAVFAQSPAVSLAKSGHGWRITTPSGTVEAKHVVLACGGYLAGLHRRVDAGVLPIATYVMVTEPLGDRMDDAMRTRAAVYDTRFAFDYYRPLPDSRLLWGGRISILDRSPQAVRRLLYRDMLKVFPQLDGVAIDYAWSGLMSYARHEMPQIGQVEPGLWVAQAFGGHGVAPTTFAGEIVAAAIAEGDERWREFSAYGLVSAMKPAGFLGAQLSYWWAEAKDAWKARTEGGGRT
ncbi:FAD-binding oxidoreductase [Pseudoxanthomonas sp. LH2527]|uniref:NAD(P)/FAD-dependent oxidoreductase n=1 Tax=Pseudoxanthomonas sp. LH2527 TaxID=2923249 RepID=UPI001F13D967|nr:FAD-binding oxidoreductase [Pseudoxanthomonas sp. LH2527]MCH6482208.1 FAD-binding oxidoreductase [Pseudoxanthomonas sp. LH2527]